MNGAPRKDLPPIGAEILVRFVVDGHEKRLGMVLVSAKYAGAPTGRFYLFPHEYEVAPAAPGKEQR